MTDHRDFSDRQKRLIYRAHHRGTKELDWLLGKYVDEKVDTMDEAGIDHFDKLMSLPEPMIEGWLMGRDEDIAPEFAEIVSEIQKYHDL